MPVPDNMENYKAKNMKEGSIKKRKSVHDKSKDKSLNKSANLDGVKENLSADSQTTSFESNSYSQSDIEDNTDDVSSPSDLFLKQIKKESKLIPETLIKQRKSSSDQESQINRFYVIGIFLLLSCILWKYSGTNDKFEVKIFECPNYDNLNKTFPDQNNKLWLSLKLGITNVNKQNPEPSVFLFAYTNESTMDQILTKVLNATVICMNSPDPIIHQGKELATPEFLKDFGIFQADLAKNLTSHGILVVKNLNNVPSKVAQAFHVICDMENPPVKKSVIFFTFKLEEKLSDNFQRVSAEVQAKLEDLWKDLDEFVLGALIARVTDEILYIL